MLTDFQNYVTDALIRQLAINWLLNIPPHIITTPLHHTYV